MGLGEGNSSLNFYKDLWCCTITVHYLQIMYGTKIMLRSNYLDYPKKKSKAQRSKKDEYDKGNTLEKNPEYY